MPVHHIKVGLIRWTCMTLHHSLNTRIYNKLGIIKIQLHLTIKYLMSDHNIDKKYNDIGTYQKDLPDTGIGLFGKYKCMLYNAGCNLERIYYREQVCRCEWMFA